MMKIPVEAFVSVDEFVRVLTESGEKHTVLCSSVGFTVVLDDCLFRYSPEGLYIYMER